MPFRLLNDSVPVLTLASTSYCLQEIYGGRLLAVGDEEGLVSVMNTAAELPKVLSQATPSAQWVGHRNAIFALQWYKVTNSLQI